MQNCSIVKVEGSAELGMGYLVDEEHIITCAHVVSPVGSSKDPIYQQPDGPVRITFLFAEGQPSEEATIAHWGPPKGELCSEADDFAVLRIDKKRIPLNVCRASLIEAETPDGHFSAYGYPKQYKGEHPAIVDGEICGASR